MKKLISVPIVASLLLAAQPGSAASQQEAASAEDDLRQCIAMRTNGADRVLTAQWMFAAMSKSPHISRLSAVTAERKTELDKGFAQLITRIAVKDCLAQMQPLAAANLQGAFELVGRALGEIAMEELMTDKNVDQAIGEYTNHLSEDDFQPLMDSIKSRSK